MPERLALHGGSPVRQALLPYGRQWISPADRQAVLEVLDSDWLTTGPMVGEFERQFAAVCGASEAVVVSSGTAALHAAAFALGIGAGDEVLVPSLTFAADANCIRYQGGTPVFVDVDRDTLLIDLADAEKKITPRTRALIAVDYGGHPCDYQGLRAICDRHQLTLVADACHSLGGSYQGSAVGSLGDLNIFSFHPVKHITTGEGGMITTNNPEFARRMRLFRNHGITSDHHQRAQQGAYFYEMVDLGFNYRLTDFQCALGLSQLGRLPQNIERRRAIAAAYDAFFAAQPSARPQKVLPGAGHAYHLYVIQLQLEILNAGRDEIYAALRAEGIGVNVHYVPVHQHPYYRDQAGFAPACPTTDDVYPRLLTLPLFPEMSTADVDDVQRAFSKAAAHYRKEG